MHWAHRGEELQHLTCFEYHALIDVQPLAANSDHGFGAKETNQGQQGRKKRPVFRFHKSHPLHHSHGQCRRSKQPTLIISGKPPPHPGDPPQAADNPSPFEMESFEEQLALWQKRAETFASFFSVIFLPQDNFYGENLAHTKPKTD